MHSEGSDTKEQEGSAGMEGSKKKVKDVTDVKGVVLINGQPSGADTVVILETKSKMRVRNQAPGAYEVDQVNLQFQPKHSVVTVGSKITFYNKDVEVHNIFQSP